MRGIKEETKVQYTLNGWFVTVGIYIHTNKLITNRPSFVDPVLRALVFKNLT